MKSTIGKRLAVGALAGLRGADRVDRRQLRVLRDEPELLLALQRLLAHRLIAHVEAALVLLDPLLRHVVRRVAGTRRVVQAERLVRRHRLGVLDELERLVGQVHGQVIAVLGLGRADRPDGCRRRGPDATGWSRRPGSRRSARTRARSASCDASRRDASSSVGHRCHLPVMYVFQPSSPEDLRQHPVLRRNRAAGVREPDRRLGDARHAVARVVAPGQQARPRRRAQGGGVPLRVAHAAARRSGRCSASPPARRSSQSPRTRRHRARCTRRWGAVRRPWRLERRPVRLRVANVDVDDALKRPGHTSKPLIVSRIVGTGGGDRTISQPVGASIIRTG